MFSSIFKFQAYRLAYLSKNWRIMQRIVACRGTKFLNAPPGHPLVPQAALIITSEFIPAGMNKR